MPRPGNEADPTPPADVRELAAAVGRVPKYRPGRRGSKGSWSVAFGAEGVAKIPKQLQRVEVESLDKWWAKKQRRRAGLIPVREAHQEARRQTGRAKITPRDLAAAAATLRYAARPRYRAPRATAQLRRGSRRVTATRGSPDDDPGDPDPPGALTPRAGRETAGVAR